MICKIFSLLTAAAITLPASAQSTEVQLAKPLNIPLYLSGNFGELRSNHFHSGLDFKTQGRTGIPVHSADDGYVSRIVVSPWGFGRAIYITHPSTGLTTVYGHLSSFSPKIDNPVRKRQYEKESFAVDLEFAPDEIPVKRGEQIALSGNSGSSGGPHLHMDVRDTKTEEALDPMPYFKQYITDKVAPGLRSLALYPVNGEGVVNGGSSPVTHSPQQASVPFKAWGKVTPAIKAYDKMSGTSNIYGVKYLTLTVDGNQVYKRVIDRFSFDNTRGINTIVDYAGVVRNNSWMMTSRVAAARPLGDMIEAVDNGVLDINEERDYKCVWILEDEHGNTRRVPFTITGVRHDIPEAVHKGDMLSWKGNNVYSGNGIKASFPAGTFYDDIYLKVTSEPIAGYVTDRFTVGDTTIPVSGEYTIEIDIDRDTVPDKNKYCLVRIDGKRRSAVDAKYVDGKMQGTPNRLGSFAVTTDTRPPVIKPEAPANWGKRGRVSYIISDNLSGITEYRGEIDGKWAMFELDGKTGRLSFTMDPSRFTRNTNHEVVLKVTDRCGNTSEHKSNFRW